MDSYDFQMKEPVGVKLPRLDKLRRPRTNYFKEKVRSESIPLKGFFKELKLTKGKSRDNIQVTNVNTYVQMQQRPVKDTVPCTKSIAEHSKRIFYSKRPEMAMKNLLIFVFDGVVGDCFKKNLWQEEPVKLYFRSAVIKELKRLKESFQISLFFLSEYIKTGKVLKYFLSKNLTFDAVYKSRQSSKKPRPNGLKKSLKSSETIQDYSQIYTDFGLQNEISEKILLITSIAIGPEDFERTGESLLYDQPSQSIRKFLCKGIPLSYFGDFPIVLAVPDPRLHHNFAGASFSAISQAIYSISQDNEEWSWLEGFYQTSLEKIETDLMIKEVLKESLIENSESPEALQNDFSRHRVLVLKNFVFTNYHFVQDFAFSIKPLYLKN